MKFEDTNCNWVGYGHLDGKGFVMTSWLVNGVGLVKIPQQDSDSKSRGMSHTRGRYGFNDFPL